MGTGDDGGDDTPQLPVLEAEASAAEELGEWALRSALPKPVVELLEKAANNLSNDLKVRREIQGQNETAYLRRAVRAELEVFGETLLEQLVALIEQRTRELVLIDPAPARSRAKVTCVLLCGGSGRRLWPVTDTVPKVLLPLARESVLERLIAQVERSNHVSSIILSTDPRSDPRRSMLCDLVSDRYQGSDSAPRTWPDGEAGGGPVVALRDIANSSADDMLIVGADNIFDIGFDFDGFIEAARADETKGKGCAGALAVVPNGDGRHDVRTLGQVEVDSAHHVRRLIEKGKTRQHEYVSAACYYFKRDHLALLDTFLDQVERPALGHFVNWLIAQAPLAPLVAYPIETAWFDMGDLDTYLEASSHYLAHQKARWSIGVPVGAPQVLQPSWVMTDPDKLDFTRPIGPNVYIGGGVEISNSTVSNSVIMRGAVLRNAEVRNSLVGPNAVIEGILENRVCGFGSRVVGPRPSWDS